MAIIVSHSSVTSRFFACGELWRIRPAAGIRGLTDAYTNLLAFRIYIRLAIEQRQKHAGFLYGFPQPVTPIQSQGRQAQTSIYLPVEMLERLQQLSKQSRISMASYLREAVEDLLKKYEEPKKRSSK
jgi:hypothetical protein